MSLPANYTALINDLNRDVVRVRPIDPLQFCANWFNSKLEEQRRVHFASNPSIAGGAPPIASQPTSLGPSDLDFGGVAPGLASPTQRASLFNSDPFAPSAAAGAVSAVQPPSAFSASTPVPMDSSASPDSTPAPAPRTNLPPPPSTSTSISNAHLIPPTFNLGRRTSVSAESMAPSAVNAQSDGSPLPKTVIPKSEEQMQRICGSIGNNLLFRNLEQDQYRDVLLAMKEVKVDADVKVIEQGAQGDYFYVVESGTLDVYVNAAPRNGDSATAAPADDATTTASASLGDKKLSYGPGSSFGELALLYAQPRAATVLSTSPCTLWALDRITFRSILMETNSRRRALYEKFLMDVPLFERLSAAERAKISDSLELREYAPGEAVITQGERGSEFFIIVEGDAEVRKTKQGASEEVVGKLSRGDYFGELALLNNAPRAATVAAAATSSASATKLRVVTMSERAFTRLLGPLAGILERHAKETYGNEYTLGHVNANAATSVNNAALACAAGEVDVGNAFPHPMDSTAKPGQGAWSAPNPFAAA